LCDARRPRPELVSKYTSPTSRSGSHQYQSPILLGPASYGTNSLTLRLKTGVFNGDPELVAGLVQGAQALEKLLAGKFALGDKFTAADVAIAPFLLRSELVWSFHDPAGVRKQIQDKAPRFWQYLQNIETHPSVASTWDRVRTSRCFLR
jgi:hypothetical protein